jgi:hypothetical protein
MPRGPGGEKRPADVIGCAVKVARISVEDEPDETQPLSGRTRSGIAGGKARAESLSDEKRAAIARTAAQSRWR